MLYTVWPANNIFIFHTVTYVCKITADMLKDQPYFPDVFNNFMQWIQEKLVQCAEKYGKNYCPGMVFWAFYLKLFIFMVIFAMLILNFTLSLPLVSSHFR